MSEAPLEGDNYEIVLSPLNSAVSPGKLPYDKKCRRPCRQPKIPFPQQPPTISHNDNEAPDNGGAVAVLLGATAVLWNLAVSNCSAFGDGGGVYVDWEASLGIFRQAPRRVRRRKDVAERCTRARSRVSCGKIRTRAAAARRREALGISTAPPRRSSEERSSPRTRQRHLQKLRPHWHRQEPNSGAEREFPALLVVWAYQQKQLIFGRGSFLFRA